MDSSKKKSLLALSALGLSSAIFIIAGVVGLIVWYVGQGSNSSSSASSAITSSSSGGVIGQIPLVTYGTMWMNEPMNGPYLYSFPGSGQYYIEIQLKPTNYDAYLVALDHPGVASHLSLYIDEDGYVIHHRATFDCDIISPQPISLNEVHTIGAGFDGNNSHLFIDGVEVAVSSVCGPLPPNTSLPLIIGAVQQFQSSFMEKFALGEFYYVKIWDSYVDQSDVTLLAYYNFAVIRSPAVGYQFVNQGLNTNPLTIQSITDSAGLP